MKVYAISDGGTGVLYIDPAEELSYGLEEIELLMEEMEIGEKITIDILSMSKEAFNALPEFEGW